MAEQEATPHSGEYYSIVHNLEGDRIAIPLGAVAVVFEKDKLPKGVIVATNEPTVTMEVGETVDAEGEPTLAFREVSPSEESGIQLANSTYLLLHQMDPISGEIHWGEWVIPVEIAHKELLLEQGVEPRRKEKPASLVVFDEQGRRSVRNLVIPRAASLSEARSRMTGVAILQHPKSRRLPAVFEHLDFEWHNSQPIKVSYADIGWIMGKGLVLSYSEASIPREVYAALGVEHTAFSVIWEDPDTGEEVPGEVAFYTKRR